MLTLDNLPHETLIEITDNISPDHDDTDPEIEMWFNPDAAPWRPSEELEKTSALDFGLDYHSPQLYNLACTNSMFRKFLIPHFTGTEWSTKTTLSCRRLTSSATSGGLSFPPRTYWILLTVFFRTLKVCCDSYGTDQAKIREGLAYIKRLFKACSNLKHLWLIVPSAPAENPNVGYLLLNELISNELPEELQCIKRLRSIILEISEDDPIHPLPNLSGLFKHATKVKHLDIELDPKSHEGGNAQHTYLADQLKSIQGPLQTLKIRSAISVSHLLSSLLRPLLNEKPTWKLSTLWADKYITQEDWDILGSDVPPAPIRLPPQCRDLKQLYLGQRILAENIADIVDLCPKLQFFGLGALDFDRVLSIWRPNGKPLVRSLEHRDFKLLPANAANPPLVRMGPWPIDHVINQRWGQLTPDPPYHSTDTDLSTDAGLILP
jgi:hypothetical protein